MLLQPFRYICSWVLFLALLLSAPNTNAVFAAPASVANFAVGDLSQWEISGTNADKLKASVKDGVLTLHWPGGVGQAIIEHKSSEQLAPFLNGGFVRYQCHLNILDDEYGSELSVQLQPLRADGKKGAPYYMRRAISGATGHVRGNEGSKSGLYAPPSEWAQVDFNYKPAANITALKPRFVLQGNAMTVAIGKATLASGSTWERIRPKAQAEPRDFDEAHVNRILQQRQQAVPRLEKRPGRIALIVNGKDVLPACYTRGAFYPQYARYAEFAKAGYDLVRLTVFMNPLSPTHKVGVGGLWKAKDTFDFSALEHELKVIANINPNALVIVSVNIMPYHEWADENPDSIVTNEKGEKLIVYGGEGEQYGGVPNHGSNREAGYAPSFYGGQFPIDAANAVRRLADFLQTSPAGKIVLGAEFVGGTDGQLYPWDRDHARGADYSPVALASWRRFLRQRYENDVQKLRAAWQDNKADFDTATIATLAERGYGSATVTAKGTDYSDFISHAMADFILGLGQALKQSSNNRLLAGVYYSDSGWQGVISHGATYRVMKSSSIDMVRSVMIYQTSGSWWQHSKLTWAELDMRPPMSSPMQYFTAGLRYSAEDFKNFAWRNAVMAVTDLRGGFYPYDMAEAWYQSPEIIRVFGEARSGLQSSIDDTVNIPPTVGVFSDEKLPFRLPDNLGYQLNRTSIIGLYRALDRSGVTYARYLLDDALAPSFTLPKVCILRLPMLLTPELAKALQEKARQTNSVLIWEYAPGAIAPGKPDSKSVSGFDAKSAPELAGQMIVMRDAGTLTTGLVGKFSGAPSPPISLDDNNRWKGQPYTVHPEAGDVVLGHYGDSRQAGAVMRSRDGLTQIILGLPGAISPQFIRNLARQTGEQPFIELDDEMRFGSGILAFHAERGGPRSVTLPVGMQVSASPTGHKYQATKNGFTYQAGYSEIAVFKISRT